MQTYPISILLFYVFPDAICYFATLNLFFSLVNVSSVLGSRICIAVAMDALRTVRGEYGLVRGRSVFGQLATDGLRMSYGPSVDGEKEDETLHTYCYCLLPIACLPNYFNHYIYGLYYIYYTWCSIKFLPIPKSLRIWSETRLKLQCISFIIYIVNQSNINRKLPAFSPVHSFTEYDTSLWIGEKNYFWVSSRAPRKFLS